MANAVGYFIVKGAISPELAAKVADEVKRGLEKKFTELRTLKYTEYKVSPLGLQVKDEFIQVYYRQHRSIDAQF
jgi:hypothetical protein